MENSGNLTREEAEKLINQKNEEATAILLEAEKLAEEHGIYFSSMRLAAEKWWESSDHCW